MPFVPFLLASITRRSTVSPIHKRNGWTLNYIPSTIECKPLSHHDPLHPSPLSTPSGMAASATYATQVSAGGYPHEHGYDRTSIHSTPLSPTLVEANRHTDRSSIELKFSSSGAKIVNSVVVDPAGRPLYSISSDSRRTKLHSQRDNTEVATINWDRSSPRMVFRGRKLKCKDWLQRAGPDTEYVLMAPFRMVTIQGDADQVSYVSARRFPVHVDGAILSWLREFTALYN